MNVKFDLGKGGDERFECVHTRNANSPASQVASFSHFIVSLALFGLRGIKTSLTDKFGFIADGKFTSLPTPAALDGGPGPGGLAF